jgi:hypothetical protein
LPIEENVMKDGEENIQRILFPILLWAFSLGRDIFFITSYNEDTDHLPWENEW